MSKRQFHQKSERLPGAPRSGVNRWCGGIEQIFTIAAAGMFAILVSITTTSALAASAPGCEPAEPAAEAPLAFRIEIEEPADCEAVDGPEVLVRGTVYLDQPIAKLELNGLELTDYSVEITPGDGAGIADGYVVGFEHEVQPTDPASILRGAQSFGTFDPGANQLFVVATDETGERVVATHRVAVGEVSSLKDVTLIADAIAIGGSADRIRTQLNEICAGVIDHDRLDACMETDGAQLTGEVCCPLKADGEFRVAEDQESYSSCRVKACEKEICKDEKDCDAGEQADVDICSACDPAEEDCSKRDLGILEECAASTEQFCRRDLALNRFLDSAGRYGSANIESALRGLGVVRVAELARCDRDIEISVSRYQPESSLCAINFDEGSLTAGVSPRLRTLDFDVVARGCGTREWRFNVELNLDVPLPRVLAHDWQNDAPAGTCDSGDRKGEACFSSGDCPDPESPCSEGDEECKDVRAICVSSALEDYIAEAIEIRRGGPIEIIGRRIKRSVIDVQACFTEGALQEEVNDRILALFDDKFADTLNEKLPFKFEAQTSIQDFLIEGLLLPNLGDQLPALPHQHAMLDRVIITPAGLVTTFQTTLDPARLDQRLGSMLPPRLTPALPPRIDAEAADVLVSFADDVVDQLLASVNLDGCKTPSSRPKEVGDLIGDCKDGPAAAQGTCLGLRGESCDLDGSGIPSAADLTRAGSCEAASALPIDASTPLAYCTHLPVPPEFIIHDNLDATGTPVETPDRVETRLRINDLELAIVAVPEGASITGSQKPTACAVGVVGACTLHAEVFDLALPADFILQDDNTSIVIDNTSLDVSLSEGWRQATGATQHWERDSLYVRSGVGMETALYIPDLPAEGGYQVDAWNSCYQPRAGNVPHTIYHRDGETIIEVDQHPSGENPQACGDWLPLGEFIFSQGRAGYVEISNAGTAPGSYVGADAIRFTPVSVIAVQIGGIRRDAQGVRVGCEPDYESCPTIIVDNRDSGATTTAGWRRATSATDHYQVDSLYAETGRDLDSARFSPDFPGPDRYRVDVWNSCYAPRSSTVHHEVRHASGTDTFLVDQHPATGVCGDWYTLGDFFFAAGQSGYVEVSDSDLAAGNYIGADAVRFTRFSTTDDEEPAPVSSQSSAGVTTFEGVDFDAQIDELLRQLNGELSVPIVELVPLNDGEQTARLVAFDGGDAKGAGTDDYLGLVLSRVSEEVCGDGICDSQEQCGSCFGEGCDEDPRCGNDCGLCSTGISCEHNGDCGSGICDNNTCHDADLADGGACEFNAACASYNCRDGVCFSLTSDLCEPCDGNSDCAGDKICNFGKCMTTLPLGLPCDGDSSCASEYCEDNLCRQNKDNGEICLRDAVCASDFCDAGTCKAPGTVLLDEVCGSDRACRSGSCSLLSATETGRCVESCGDSFCEGIERCGGQDASVPGEATLQQCKSDCGTCGNGEFCLDDGMCTSGLCNGSVCVSPLPNGFVCVRDEVCQSDICNAGICVSALANGSVCVKDEACQSGLCNAGVCRAPGSRPALALCTADAACSSGSCTGGTCEQICGDGFCDGAEQCGGNNSTFQQCRDDCGKCSVGTACLSDNACATGFCSGAICSPKKSNGSVCARDNACNSNNCQLGICRS